MRLMDEGGSCSETHLSHTHHHRGVGADSRGAEELDEWMVLFSFPFFLVQVGGG